MASVGQYYRNQAVPLHTKLLGGNEALEMSR